MHVSFSSFLSLFFYLQRQRAWTLQPANQIALDLLLQGLGATMLPSEHLSSHSCCQVVGAHTAQLLLQQQQLHHHMICCCSIRRTMGCPATGSTNLPRPAPWAWSRQRIHKHHHHYLQQQQQQPVQLQSR